MSEPRKAPETPFIAPTSTATSGNRTHSAFRKTAQRIVLILPLVGAVVGCNATTSETSASAVRTADSIGTSVAGTVASVPVGAAQMGKNAVVGAGLGTVEVAIGHTESWYYKSLEWIKIGGNWVFGSVVDVGGGAFGGLVFGAAK